MTAKLDKTTCSLAREVGHFDEGAIASNGCPSVQGPFFSNHTRRREGLAGLDTSKSTRGGASSPWLRAREGARGDRKRSNPGGRSSRAGPRGGRVGVVILVVVFCSLGLNLGLTRAASPSSASLASSSSSWGPYPVHAEFNWSARSLEVRFTDLSKAYEGDGGGFTTIVSWSWSFGDNAWSEERNPTHEYSGAGNYTVTLVAHDSSGSLGMVSHLVRVTLEDEAIFPLIDRLPSWS